MAGINPHDRKGCWFQAFTVVLLQKRKQSPSIIVQKPSWILFLSTLKLPPQEISGCQLG